MNNLAFVPIVWTLDGDDYGIINVIKALDIIDMATHSSN